LWFWQDCNLKNLKNLKSKDFQGTASAYLQRRLGDLRMFAHWMIGGCNHHGLFCILFYFFCKNDGYDKRSWMGGPTTNQDPFDETK
jgi:hypothetical protein